MGVRSAGRGLAGTLLLMHGREPAFVEFFDIGEKESDIGRIPSVRSAFGAGLHAFRADMIGPGCADVVFLIALVAKSRVPGASALQGLAHAGLGRMRVRPAVQRRPP